MQRTVEIPEAPSSGGDRPVERPLLEARRASDHDLAYRRALMDIILERRARVQELDLVRRKQLQELVLKRFLAYFSCATFGTVILVTLCLCCLQGFHLWGFHLEESLMHWLGGATIGSLASLMTIVYKRLL